MPDVVAQLHHQLIRVRIVDGKISIPFLPSANTRIQVCVRGEDGRLRNVDPSVMSIGIICSLAYGASAEIVFDQTVVMNGTEVFIELVDGEEMPLCGRGWADDAGEEDAGCPDYDSFMSVFEQK